MERAGRIVPYLALLLWTVFLYFPALPQPFVYDDNFQITNNPRIKSLDGAVEYFWHPIDFADEFATQSGPFYRPVFWLTLAGDWRVWGLNPEGFHAFNIAIHFLNGILIFILFRRWFPPIVALCGALAWLSLPIHSEVVAWISGRGLALATASILVAVLSTVNYAKRRNPVYLVVLVLSSFAAMLSHEAGIVVFPLVLLFASRTVIGPVLACSGVPLAVYAGARMFLLRSATPAIATPSEFVLKAPVSVAKYIWWTIHAPPMSMERSTEFATLSFASWTYVLAWLTIVAVGVVCFRCRRSIPAVTLGIAAALCALLPFAQILPLYQSVAERYVYTASIGIVLAIVAGLARLPRWASIAALSVWMIFSVAPLRTRVRAWSSERTLYTTSLRSSPRSYVLYQNLGVLDQEAGRADAAIAYYTQALKLKPSAPTARRNLANLYYNTRRLPEAAQEFQELLTYVPDDFQSQINLATILLVQGDTDRAVSMLNEVVAKHPESVEAHVDLGLALFSKGDPAARLHLETALQLKPDSPEAAYNLGVLEEEAGHFENARNLYQRALRFRPVYPKASERLAALSRK